MNLFGQTYRTIAADPPWLERGGGKCKRGADRHYPLMTKEDILQAMVEAAPWNPDPTGCHLYLWTTNNFLLDGLWLMEMLGFRYVTMLTWVKPRYGLGYYYRGQTEPVLFGRLGNTMPPACRSESTLVEAPLGRHSEKPVEFYRKVEAVSPGPRLEMFARAPRDGWDVWGNEV